jgi:signal transduction histidine kinase
MDFSAARPYLSYLRRKASTELSIYLQDHPQVVAECAQRVRVTDVNPAAMAMQRADCKDELLGSFENRHRTVLHAAFQVILVALAEGRAHAETHAVVQSPDGEERHVLVRWTATADDAGDWSRVIVAVVDVTEFRRAESVLLRRTGELQERIEELDEFAHTVAHDLKNPLTTIVGFAESIDEHLNDLPVEQIHEYLQAIAWSGRKMTSIIQELLLLASVRKAEIQSMPLDMGRVVGQGLQRLIFMIEQNQAEVMVAETWPLVQGYPPWVEEVWVNYISNAVKYGGQPPRVELGATTQGNTVRFWVRDNGPGIPPDLWPELFKPFSRLNHVHAEGHGLGLSIVRHIVEKLDGQVGVHSEIGLGSTFYFTLPIVRLDE